jgi:hypothetical protein
MMKKAPQACAPPLRGRESSDEILDRIGWDQAAPANFDSLDLAGSDQLVHGGTTDPELVNSLLD